LGLVTTENYHEAGGWEGNELEGKRCEEVAVEALDWEIVQTYFILFSLLKDERLLDVSVVQPCSPKKQTSSR
jgi:hypothetical protein